MTCDNKCEIVEWNVSNPQLVEEVTSPNVSIHGILRYGKRDCEVV
jgi:hypothetical protein